MKSIQRILVLLLAGLAATGLPAQFFDAAEVIEPRIQARLDPGARRVVFDLDVPANAHITDVKNHFFRVTLADNAHLAIERVVFPEGVPYGEESVFKGNVRVEVFLVQKTPLPGPTAMVFTVGYQICQEFPQEVCFPPASREIEVVFERDLDRARTAADGDPPTPLSVGRWVEKTVREQLEKGSPLLFLLVFLAGFLTSLTPCVYPVIPIVMGYVGSRSGKSRWRGFYLSVFFVLGLSTVYSVLGVIAAQTGSLIGVSFQNPLVVVVIAAVFILMGLSLAGLFEIPVPSGITARMQSGRGGVVGALVVGGIAGIIAAPCVGPVLIALLSWITQTGNVGMGFLLTFTFSLGLGVIFLLAGTFSGVLSSLPKGGAWMSTVKYAFSLLLIAGGLYFLDSVIPTRMSLLLWSVFLISTSVFLGLFKSLEGAGKGEKIGRVLVLLLFLLGAFLFFRSLEGVFSGRPAAVESPVTAESLNWRSDLEEGRRTAERQGRILMIDTTAEWCAACKELDERTFSQPEVRAKLGEMVLVKLDFTAQNAANDRLRRDLGVIGMPTVIFLNPAGEEVKRFSGFVDQREFLRILSTLPRP